MKILLIGASGALGTALKEGLRSKTNLLTPSHQQFDLTKNTAIQTQLRTYQPDVIINAAAYTAVDQAQIEKALAYQINAHAVSELASYAQATNCLLIHYSTDYVFSGTKIGAYTETDQPAPAGVYAQSKLAGEEAITQTAKRYLIFRTSWVYGPAGKNFPKTILKLAGEKEQLKIVDDQQGAPTSTLLITEATINALEQFIAADYHHQQKLCGIYHLSAQGQTTWCAFARYLLASLQARKPNLKLAQIEAITTAEFGAPAPRPRNSKLDCAKLKANFVINLPKWEVHADEFINYWINLNSNAN